MTATGSHRAAQHTASEPGAPGRLAPLDGLRGIAIAAVVLYHFGWLGGGFLGVDLFFVVSGFVITRMLIERRDGGGALTLTWFWARRLRRLLPALLLLCAAVLVWTLASSAGLGSSAGLHRQTLGEALTAIVYGNNWYDIYANVGYFDVALAKTPLNHLWSLSIEEQFYLVWPVLFIVLTRRTARLRKLVVIATVLAVASVVLQPWYFARDGYARAYLGTDTRIDAILIGVLLALALTRPLKSGWSLSSRALVLTRVLAVVAAAGMIAAWLRAGVSAPGLYQGGLIAISVAGGVLLFAATTDPGGWLARALSLPPVVGLGRVSYSLYLWHLPIIVLVTGQTTRLAGAPLTLLRLALIGLTTTVSYLLVERPVHLRGLSPRRSSLAVAATALCCLAAGLAPNALAHLGHPASTPTAATGSYSFTAAEVQAQTIMIVGDSWGLRTEDAMSRMAAPKPKSVIFEAQPSCGIADPVNEYAQNGATFTPTATCLAWRDTWQNQVSTANPTISILQIGNWDQARQQFSTGGPWLTPCDPAYQARYNQHLDQAIAILTGRHAAVFIPTVRDNDGATRAQSDCMNTMLRAAATRHASQGVHILDLDAELCPNHHCLTTIGGLATYDDTGHIAFNILPTINRWIFAQIGNILGTQRPALDLWAGTTQTVITPPSTVAAPNLATKLPPAGTLTGTRSSTETTIQVAHTLDSVTALSTSPSYTAITTGLATCSDSAAYSTDHAMAAATLTYTADTTADAASLAIQNALLHAGATLTVDNDNLKYLTTGPSSARTTVGFLRGLDSLSLAITTTGTADTQLAHARATLRAIGQSRGIPLP